jgi:putative tryptophan/tyrosine transport system substrate-binding protein
LRAGDENTKLFQLLHELAPAATVIGVLVYRAGVAVDSDIYAIQTAASSMGVKTIVSRVSDDSEFGAAFAGFADAKVGAVFVNGHRYFDFHLSQIVDLATRNRFPVVSVQPDYAVAGALATYGADFYDGLRQAGNYVGRVLKGEKPADLPVLQPTKFRFIINLKTARTLGLEIPTNLLIRADEVIE